MSTRIQAVDLFNNLDSNDLKGDIARLESDFQSALERKRYQAKVIKTARPGVTLGTMRVHDERYIIVYEDEHAVGFVYFEKPTRRISPTSAIVTPHARFLPKAQGKGYASSVYTWALSSGMCFISAGEQSTGANMLWLKLGKVWPWFLIREEFLSHGVFSYEGRGEHLTRKQLNEEETRLVLLGKGWTLEKFASAISLKFHAQGYHDR